MTIAKNKYAISSLLFRRAILLLFVAIIPIGIIHEIGHWSASELQGVHAKIIIDLPAMKTIASSIPSNALFYYWFGGGLAAIVSGVIALVFRARKSVVIPMLTVMISQLVTSLVETFMHGFYVDQFWVPVLSYMLFIPLLAMFGRDTLGIEYKPIPIPKFLKSTRLMIALIGVIAFLVIFMDTITTSYFLSHYKYGIEAEDNLLARLLLTSTGWIVILGLKILGVSAMAFVCYSMSKVQKYMPLVNVGLIAILLVYSYVASNNVYLVLKLLLR